MDNPVPQRKFDYRGYVITIELTGAGEQLSVGADVHTNGQPVGRVALTAGEGSCHCLDALVEKLERKAKELIDHAMVSGERAAAGNAAGQLLKAAC